MEGYLVLEIPEKNTLKYKLCFCFHFGSKKNVNLSGKKTLWIHQQFARILSPKLARSWKTSLGTRALCSRGLDVASWSIHDSLV